MKILSLKLFFFLFRLSLAPAAFATDPTSHPRPRPPRQALWECMSRNMRGERFYGLDPIREWSQGRAQNKCQRRSYACRPLSCHQV